MELTLNKFKFVRAKTDYLNIRLQDTETDKDDTTCIHLASGSLAGELCV